MVNNLNDKVEMMDHLLDILEGEDVLDLDSRQYDEMSRLLNMIEYSSDENLAIQFLSNDQTFVDCFGTEDPKGRIISRMEQSNEHLLQDFLRWGIPGMIAGTILARLSRIRSICAKAKITVDQEKFDNWSARSIYLPPAQKMKLIMAAMEELVKGDVDPNSGKTSKVISTDWKAVAGDWAGTLLLAGVGGIIGNAAGGLLGLLTGTMVGKHVAGSGSGSIGAHMASDNGGTLADKGYTKMSLVDYADRMAKLIDDVHRLKNMRNQEGVHENADNLSAKLRFVKKAIDVLTHTIKNVGRGLAAAIGHVS